MLIIDSMDKLLNHIITNCFEYDGIVVEGYDCVGKGRVLTDIAYGLNTTVYRPDYTVWTPEFLGKEERWKLSAYYLDICSKLHIPRKSLNIQEFRNNPIDIFDRGVLSGYVYNHVDIRKFYKEILRDYRLLHVIVTCDEYSFFKYLESRNNNITEQQKHEELFKLAVYTESYVNIAKELDLLACVYINSYDQCKDNSNTCEGCGHYSYGVCKNPRSDYYNNTVNDNLSRCKVSNDEEIQDVQ